jgi:YfiH family protein
MERITATEGLVYYCSPALAELGVPHAFSTRLGGVSRGIFASLNFGNPAGAADDPDHLAENHRRLLRAIGCCGRKLLRVHQVHGARVVEAPPADGAVENADAIVTGDAATLAGVRTADCVPLLLATPDGRRVAAVHAGWRGAVAGVATQAVRGLCADRYRPGDLLVAIGPAIGFEAFEVGTEVLAAFGRVWGSMAPVRWLGERGRVDLRQSLILELGQAGVPRHRIDCSDRCTVTHGEEFFSHRRDHGLTGRMLAIIGPAA